MNALLQLDGVAWWHVAGWTMLHYLWMGALVGVAALVSRIALRRASANVRYAAALACFAVLAVLPVGIGIGVGFEVLGVRDAGESVAPIDQPIAKLVHPSAPGSAGGIVELKREGSPVKTALVDDPVPVEIINPDSNPRQSRGLPGVPANIAVYLPWVWIVGAPLTFLLLTTGVVGAERLRRQSRILQDGPVADAAARIAESLQIGRRVTIAVCERIAAPVLVGIVRPMILLPPAALTGWSPDEIEMVLLHELAHVRRWDNLVNLVQRMVEAVLFFQPAVWLVSNWVRREREACCDAVVVGRTNRPHAYAELLVEFAAMMSSAGEPGRPRPRFGPFTRGRGRPGSLISSAMAAGPLRGRIRYILGIEDDPLLISGKSLGVVMSSLLLTATLVVLNLPTNTQAEEEGFTTEVAEDTEKTKVEVPFEVGASKFADGDSVTISNVHGTSTKFEAGGTYWVEGSYTLASRDWATLAANVTAVRPNEGRSRGDGLQQTSIERGSGIFKLRFSMTYPGQPHVSFYPADGGQSFGGVYFGTGDSVLKEWWGEKELTTEDTEDTESEIVVAKMRAATQNNLKDLAIGLLNYQDAMKNFPPRAKFDAEGKPLLSWRVLVLPYLSRAYLNPDSEEAKLYAEFHLDEPWDSDHNRQLIARMPAVFNNPRIDKPGMTNYLAVVGRECMFDDAGKPVRIAQVADGTSNTISIVEADADRAVEWTKPADWEFDRERPTAGLGKLWPDGWFAAWVDGSVRSVSNKEKPDQVGIQFTRGGRESESLNESAGRTATRGQNGMGGEFGMGMEGGMGGEMMGGRGGEFGMEERLEMRAAPAKTFPTLEEQKLADIVYRQLGLELEPLTADDLQRVRALGFDGGMKVSLNDGSVISWERNRAGIVPNDILVGLHVWPTKSAADVVEVLNRDDLAELNPLKFYLIRQVEDSNPFGAMGREGVQIRDEVVTGRITVKVPAAKLPQTVPSSALKPSTGTDSSAEELLNAFGMKSNNEHRDRPNGSSRDVTTSPKRSTSLPAHEPIPIPPLSDAEKAELLKGGPFTLEFYYSPDSQPCRDAEKLIAEYQAAFPGLIEVERIDVVADPARAARMGLRHVPMLRLTRKQSFVDEKTGVWTLPQLTTIVTEYARRRSAPTANQVQPQILQAAIEDAKRRGPLKIEFYYQRDSEPSEQVARMLFDFKETYGSGLIDLQRIDVDESPSVAKDRNVGDVPALVSVLKDNRTFLRNVPELTAEQLADFVVSELRTMSLSDARQKLHYDGKTFDAWRSAWKTELSTEKRLEAVQALAAFGANGNGKEAAEAILEVVEQLDWTSIDDSSAGRLKQACVDALTTGRTTGGYRVKSGDWLPLLVNRLTNGSPTIRLFSMYVISQLPVGDRDAIQPLLALSQQKEFRPLAFSGLKAVDPRLENSDVRVRFRQALSQPTEEPATLVGVISYLLYYSEPISGGMGPAPKLQYLPEFGPLLLHKERDVRQSARMSAIFIQPEDAPALVKQLLAVINDDARAADRIEAIRALAAIGSEARPAEEQLVQIAKSQNDPARHAAALALVAIWDDNDDSFRWGDNFYERLFGGDYMQKIDYDAFQNGMIAEEKELFGKNEKQRILGGGGGIF